MAKPGPKGPSKYRPELCDELLEFFDIPHSRVIKTVTTGKGDFGKVEEKEVANDLPHFVTFAQKIGVSVETLNAWTKTYPEFSEAYSKAKLINERMLASNALKGLYNATFAIFMAKNKFGWRDEQHIKGEGVAPQIVIVRADGNKTETLSGRLHLHRSSVPGNGISLGNGEEPVSDSQGS